MSSSISRAGVDHFTQPAGDVVGCARHRNRIDAGHFAVDAPQPGEHALAGPRRVVVDHQVDPLADGEVRGVFLLFVEFTAHHGDGSGERFGGRRARAQERVAVAHRPGQGLRGKAAEPDRRVRSLHRLGLDGKVVDVAEPAVERHPGLVGPGRLHQFQTLGEIRDVSGLLHAEGGELARAAAGRDTDVQPAVAEPVDGGRGRGQLQRIMQRRHQDGDAQAQSLGAGRAVRQQLQRCQQRRLADDLLEHPAALEPELLGAGKVRAQPGGVEAVGVELGDGDREPHPTTVRRRIGRLVEYVRLPALDSRLIKLGDDIRALAGRVDTARHHGVPNGCVLEFDLRSVPPETTGFDPLAIITGGGRPMALRDAVAAHPPCRRGSPGRRADRPGAA